MASPFPGSADTDATLYVAADNIQTTLNVVQNPTDTVAIVASTTGWLANMIATIDNEQELVTGVSGANTLQVTRNFNGTGAVAHPAGRKVSNFVDAAYHAAVSSAIQAIEGTMLGTTALPGTYSLKSSDGKYYWSFNNTAEVTGIFSQFGQKPSPLITALPPSAPGPGTAEYHIYYHDAANSGVGAIGDCAAFQGYLEAGSGGTLVGVWADVTTEGTWTPQGASGGVTNGPMGASFTATLAHSTGPGGYACSINTYAVCNGPSPGAQLTGMEIDLQNHVSGTGGHAGILVVDQSTQPTSLAGADYGYGLVGQGGSPGFQQGINIQAGGVSPNGTIFMAAGSVKNGIDFSGVTFGSGGLVLNLPGFSLSPGGLINSPLTIQSGVATSTSLTITSGVKTTGDFLDFVHSTTACTSTVLSMNMAVTSGSFTGNFITNFINSVLKFNVDYNGAVTSGPQNYLPSTGGAANAITVTLPVAQIAGLMLTIKLSAGLQAGANTLNGQPIRSSRNPANNIATAYAAGGTIRVMWDGAEWVDLSQ